MYQYGTYRICPCCHTRNYTCEPWPFCSLCRQPCTACPWVPPRSRHAGWHPAQVQAQGPVTSQGTGTGSPPGPSPDTENSRVHVHAVPQVRYRHRGQGLHWVQVQALHSAHLLMQGTVHVHADPQLRYRYRGQGLHRVQVQALYPAHLLIQETVGYMYRLIPSSGTGTGAWDFTG